mmetsp:Transcript_34187/g.80498  ORF Transcript_34187/g.80498 Transcript_34187/m.80498 type:complete len:236 (+) Transcript_34187:1632-2339(+)
MISAAVRLSLSTISGSPRYRLCRCSMILGLPRPTPQPCPRERGWNPPTSATRRRWRRWHRCRFHRLRYPAVAPSKRSRTNPGSNTLYRNWSWSCLRYCRGPSPIPVQPGRSRALQRPRGTDGAGSSARSRSRLLPAGSRSIPAAAPPRTPRWPNNHAGHWQGASPPEAATSSRIRVQTRSGSAGGPSIRGSSAARPPSPRYRRGCIFRETDAAWTRDRPQRVGESWSPDTTPQPR